MAGSYQHCVTDDGRLRAPGASLDSQIENLGDAYEAIEEMYGMIWLLAAERVQHAYGVHGAAAQREARELIDDAKRRYKQGLAVSPGTEDPS